MTTWYTADLHFGHVNIIDYAGRPYTDPAAMNEGLIQRWNAVVAPGDTTWVLGDVAMGKIADSLPLVGRLNGRKLLLTGNHDRCWPGNGPKAQAWEAKYLDAGFAEIHHGQIDGHIGGIDVTMCHFPYAGDSHDEDRYVDQRPIDNGQVLIHGHVHESWAENQRQINVGVDVRDFQPISDDELYDIIRNLKET